MEDVNAVSEAGENGAEASDAAHDDRAAATCTDVGRDVAAGPSTDAPCHADTPAIQFGTRKRFVASSFVSSLQWRSGGMVAQRVVRWTCDQ